MLQSLYIENYALISQLSMEFGPGLNLLTGETGSGKSIVVDALGLLLGAKGSAEMIRGGAGHAVIVGSFSLCRRRALAALAEEMGLELESDELLVKRELVAGGQGEGQATVKTRAFLNDRPATVAALRALAPWLAEIHGQNEQQELFSPAAQLELLDRFAGNDTEAVEEAFGAWRAAGERLASLSRDEQERLRLADLWSFQKREIESAQPRPGEDAELETDKRVLANAARIQAALAAAYQQLYEAPGAAAPSVAAALRQLEDVARFDDALAPVCDELRTARVTLEEAAFTVRQRLDRLDANPARLEQVEERLAALDRLKRKYGTSLHDVCAFLEKVTRQLEELESSEELAAQARQELEAAAERYRKEAAKLSSERKEAARRLERAVRKILAELAMEGTRFQAQFEEAPEWRARGAERLEFLLSPNPGEPLRPLAQVASGGELSRVMLALRTAGETGGRGSGAGGRGPGGHTLVFDEIDAGIGGRVAEIVGRKLKALASAAHQVLCVTHLPQIAAFADRHYFVEKHEQGGRTVTLARLLDERERPQELARMLSGARITDAVLEHARQMLKTGAKA